MPFNPPTLGRALKMTKKVIFISSVFFIIFMLFAIGWDRFVAWKTKDQIFNSVEELPSTLLMEQQNTKSLIALVLGTSKYIRAGTLNAYYTYRLDSAYALYQKNNHSHFLLSGDNANKAYNEPKTMRLDLIKRGIPSTQLHLDYAGFRTLDSIIRASAVFDIKQRFIIISQRFHCERALYIANHFNIDAICLVATDPTFKEQGNFIRIREVFARVKMALDLYVLNSQPKFLGPKEPIS